jgi:hypothetical protein
MHARQNSLVQGTRNLFKRNRGRERSKRPQTGVLARTTIAPGEVFAHLLRHDRRQFPIRIGGQLTQHLSTPHFPLAPMPGTTGGSAARQNILNDTRSFQRLQHFRNTAWAALPMKDRLSPSLVP